ncbi:MAG TPA: ferritin family protein [Lentimicrobium sp.]|jgi:rubrerythrin|nr:ferritin family protein [Lentimicrobium sp.]
MDTKAIDILKTAILMERRGSAFYSTVAEQTQIEEVKKIFNMMADEERLHIKFLSDLYLNYTKGEPIEKFPPVFPNGVSEMILTEELKKQISAAGYEAAAISAAIDMETKAIEVYTRRAMETTEENEKHLYMFLAEWEQGHHKILHELNEALKEEVWYDNHFWPF